MRRADTGSGNGCVLNDDGMVVFGKFHDDRVVGDVTGGDDSNLRDDRHDGGPDAALFASSNALLNIRELGATLSGSDL